MQLGALCGSRAQEAPVYEIPPVSPSEITDDVRTRAAAGVAQAQYRLAMHLLGAGGDDNVRSALDLFVAAARQGFPPALFRLGMLHHFGRGPGLDRDAGLPLIERAAELGDTRAMRYAAEWLFDYPGGADNAAHGIAFFTALAEHGSHEAAKIVVERLLAGRAVPADFAAAARWLGRDDSAWAGLWLAVLHAKGAGVALDAERSRVLERAALERASVEEKVDFARQLATAAPDVRDGEWALRVIDGALSDPSNRSPTSLNVLAEVYASLGRYGESLGAQQEAIAGLGRDPELDRTYRAEYERRLAFYRSRAGAAGAPR